MKISLSMRGHLTGSGLLIVGLLLTLPVSGSISTESLRRKKWITLAQPFELLHRVIIAPRHGIDLSSISLSHSGYPLRQCVCEIVLFRRTSGFHHAVP